MKRIKSKLIALCISGAAFNTYSSDLALNELMNLSEFQLGVDNSAVIDLEEASHSSAVVQQKSIGDKVGNAAKIKQRGNYNDAFIAQQGSRNIAYINQRGDYNEAAVSQDGYENMGVIYQLGNNNKAGIVQKGRRNKGKISQYGDDNKALIVQKSNVRSFRSDIQQTGGQTHVIINGMNKNITVR
ncbi:hypothetical protein [Photobacterium atrarenae]|uniref:Curlin subunit CsgB n=1 Tax=Photobacterium atrarenae TaxID=865757 RepID=A0ABY5GK67_9GAMM|nr:hypothetical protein [Photobacterium atrarenae]UTV29079.1 hypothetical protein NNL38_07585 [Photobacterium atrarenae]